MEKPVIDFVQTWVDGNDPAWRARRQPYLPDSSHVDSKEIRYRDWKLLHYWFRGVEKFAPWVRYVYLVTDRQCPEWLRKEHPKLRLVDHRDYIPAEYLPTFSSRVIELNLHRLPDLSEHFVLFNDDTFIIKPLKPETFFCNGLPADDGILSPVIVTQLIDTGCTMTNNMCVINHHFNKKETFRAAPWKWLNPKYGIKLMRTLMLLPWRHFPGFYNDHLPQPFLKSTFEEVWEAQPEILHRTCTHRFRDYQRDVNQWLIRYWQLAGNRFVPASPSRGKDLQVLRESTFEHIKKRRTAMVCVNDNENITDFEERRDRLEGLLHEILPEPSSFEKADSTLVCCTKGGTRQ